MASTLRELLVSFGVDADPSKIEAFDSAIDAAKGHMNDLVEVAKYVTAAIVAVGGAALYQASATAEHAEALQDQAAALGVSTDQLQELQFIATQSGLAHEQLAQSIAKVTVAQQAALNGGQAQAESFDKIGISLEELASLDPAALFEEVAIGLAAVEDPAERLALANSLLGDELARKVMPMLAAGAEGFGELAQQAHDLGLVMGEDDLEAASAFALTLDLLTSILGALRNEIGLALIPAMQEVAGQLLDWYAANQELIKQKIETYAQILVAGFLALGAALQALNAIVGGVEGWERLIALFGILAGVAGIAFLVVKFVLLASSIAGAVASAAALVGGGWMLVALIGAIVAGVAQLLAGLAVLAGGVLVILDFWAYISGADSVMGRLIDKWREAPGLLGAMVRFLESIGAVGGAVLNLLSIGWDKVSAALAPAVAGASMFADVLIGRVMWALDQLAPLVDIASAALNGLAGLLGGPGAAGTGTAGTAEGAATGAVGSVYGAAGATAASYAPTSSAAAAAVPAQVSVAGDTISISGVGISKEEAQELIVRYAEEKARATADALAGAEA